LNNHRVQLKVILGRSQLAREGNVQQPAEFASKLAPTDDAGKGSGIGFHCTHNHQREETAYVDIR
jgi:hypothetical protein